jgi:glucose-6-phosphate 1-dehydrogenase
MDFRIPWDFARGDNVGELKRPNPCVLVIFGAAGDLTWRKLIPALYNLFKDHRMPEQFSIVGVDRKPLKDNEFQQRLYGGVTEFSRSQVEEGIWSAFISHLDYHWADFSDSKVYTELSVWISQCEQAWHAKPDLLFYLATLPRMVGTITRELEKAGLTKDRERARVIVEKPFGRDLDSACALNRLLTRIFVESQIYRIDHYLGKETVQNILAFRFANALFEPLWDRRYIDCVQISVTEQVGIGHRGDYYDHAGALRDIVQNHLLQVLCLIAMEPPVSFQAEEVRNKKADVLYAIRAIPREQVNQVAVRGQYGEGWINGKRAPAYRAEPDVTPDSSTETFAALKLYVDNWRWQGVPFYLCTGKRLPAKISEVCIQFRPVPHRAFPATALSDWRPNRLTIRIQPEEGIALQFQAKRPGLEMSLSSANMEFHYKDAFNTRIPDAYETLMLDVMLADTTLFMRADRVEAAWSVLMPVLEVWEAEAAKDFPNYPAGTWGPDSVNTLFAREGHRWVLVPPTEEKVTANEISQLPQGLA